MQVHGESVPLSCCGSTAVRPLCWLVRVDSAGASEAAVALVMEREERWRERDAKLIAELWRYLQSAQQVCVCCRGGRCAFVVGVEGCTSTSSICLPMKVGRGNGEMCHGGSK